MRFPKERSRIRRWAWLCGRKHFTHKNVTRNTRICSKHFPPNSNLNPKKNLELVPFYALKKDDKPEPGGKRSRIAQKCPCCTNEDVKCLRGRSKRTGKSRSQNKIERMSIKVLDPKITPMSYEQACQLANIQKRQLQQPVFMEEMFIQEECNIVEESDSQDHLRDSDPLEIQESDVKKERVDVDPDVMDDPLELLTGEAFFTKVKHVPKKEVLDIDPDVVEDQQEFLMGEASFTEEKHAPKVE